MYYIHAAHILVFILSASKESIDQLKARMHARVREEYPDPEEDKPEEAREGYVPQAILEVMEEREKEMAEDKNVKDRRSPTSPATRTPHQEMGLEMWLPVWTTFGRKFSPWVQVPMR